MLITKKEPPEITPKTWSVSDELLKDQICEALWRDQNIDATDIEILVDQGVVTLDGFVDCYENKSKAEHCASQINGYLELRNNLILRS